MGPDRHLTRQAPSGIKPLQRHVTRSFQGLFDSPAPAAPPTPTHARGTQRQKRRRSPQPLRNLGRFKPSHTVSASSIACSIRSAAAAAKAPQLTNRRKLEAGTPSAFAALAMLQRRLTNSSSAAARSSSRHETGIPSQLIDRPPKTSPAAVSKPSPATTPIHAVAPPQA